MKKETRGGKRTGAGRKPSTDKKQTVCLYIETSKIEKAGGMEKMKERLYASLTDSKCNCERCTGIPDVESYYKNERYSKDDIRKYGKGWCITTWDEGQQRRRIMADGYKTKDEAEHDREIFNAR